MKNLNTAKEAQTAYAIAVDTFLTAYAAEDWETACSLTFEICDIHEFAQDIAAEIEDAKEYTACALRSRYNGKLAQVIDELNDELDEWVAAFEWIEDYRADEYHAAVDELQQISERRGRKSAP